MGEGLKRARAAARRTRRPKIICICGSSQFIEQIAVLAWELEKQGAITLGMHLLPANYPGVKPDHQAEAEGVRERMDELHLRKIDMADEVLVVNVGGYVGSSTRNEIAYARRKKKPIKWLEPDNALSPCCDAELTGRSVTGEIALKCKQCGALCERNKP